MIHLLTTNGERGKCGGGHQPGKGEKAGTTSKKKMCVDFLPNKAALPTMVLFFFPPRAVELGEGSKNRRAPTQKAGTRQEERKEKKKTKEEGKREISKKEKERTRKSWFSSFASISCDVRKSEVKKEREKLT